MWTHSRLYAILDVDIVQARGLAPLEVCDSWLDAGVRLIQLRAKTMASGPMLALADALVARARAAGATLLINDRADIARLSGADGVHVGQDDLSPADARVTVGPDAIVGLSTHTEAQIAAAVTQPVSYIAVGPVFGTRTKDTGYGAVGLDLVRTAAAAAHAAGLPLVAIGGITRANASSVFDAGADSVAVIGDLMGDTTAELRRAATLFLGRT
jgi:thiamine-phosphate pyrophosphorylase